MIIVKIYNFTILFENYIFNNYIFNILLTSY